MRKTSRTCRFCKVPVAGAMRTGRLKVDCCPSSRRSTRRSQHERYDRYRSKIMGILSHPSPRRNRLWRLHRADYLFALFEDGGGERTRAAEVVRVEQAPRQERYRID